MTISPDWLKGNLIAAGSFGSVHLAIDSATGSLFVAKSALSESGILPLLNEASILVNLDSPYIVKLIGKDVSSASNKMYTLFFEYMAGGSLSHVAHNFGGTLNEKLIRLYTKEILHGLNYLHTNGIVHCDIKCKNVLLGTSGNVKLADFGCAKRVSDKKCHNNSGVSGTPLWMAPEVIRNEGLDFGADIWSLGCTVIEMATGKPPWDDAGEEINPIAAMLRIAKGDDVPAFPRNLSEDGLDFLSKCLQRDPRKRWTSKQLLGHPYVMVGDDAVYGCGRKEVVRSPTSVLDSTTQDSDDDEEDRDEDEFSRRARFGAKFCLLDKKFLPNYKALGNCCPESSDNWITVRSSGGKM